MESNANRNVTIVFGIEEHTHDIFYSDFIVCAIRKYWLKFHYPNSMNEISHYKLNLHYNFFAPENPKI